jgi:hypothetical protein
VKVFVRGTTDKNPMVVAFYPDDADVSATAHGEGVTVLTLPAGVIAAPKKDGGSGMPTLIDDWRDRAGAIPVEAEAKRRINEAFPLAEQIDALQDMLTFLMKHGANPATWPEDALARKAEIDVRWKYVGEVKERARAHGSVPVLDPGSDKIWPTRIPKKK